MIIYKDEKRTIDATDGILSVPTNTKIPAIRLAGIDICSVDAASAKALQSRNDEPADWFALAESRNHRILGCFPNAAKVPITDAIAEAKAAKAAEEAELEAKRNLPANIERNRVHTMFAAAEAKRDYPGDYFPALQKAEIALKQWQNDYPAAAKAERKTSLLHRADEDERKAKDALGYDSDGWLDAAARQARHDEMMAKATAIRAEAEAL